MKILGIYDDHNASIAFSENGKIKFAISEERLCGIKNFQGFPKKSIDYLFNNFRIDPQDIDIVSFCSKQRDIDAGMYQRDLLFRVKDHKDYMDEFWNKKLAGKKYNKNYVKIKLQNKTKSYYYEFYKKNIKHYKNSNIYINKIIHDIFLEDYNIPNNKIKFFDHHFCHVLHSYYSNPNLNLKKKYIGLTIDAYGDNKNQTVWSIKNNKFKLLAHSNECEIARIYRMVTLFLNMQPLEHEFKIMGLAPYSQYEDNKKISNFFSTIIKLEGFVFKHNKRPKNLYNHISKFLYHYRFDSICAGLQNFVEENLINLIENISKKTKIKDFVYSGGVAMNVKANKLLHQNKFVKSIFVPGAPDDQGTVIGACYAATLKFDNLSPQPINNYYLGHIIKQISIDKISKNLQILKPNKYKFIENVKLEKIVSLLKKNEIIGRCAGKMEFGSRALGNRSILANPLGKDVIMKLNKTIKNRDFWMPFAGTVPKKLSKLCISNNKNIDGSFMTMSFDGTNYELCRAVSHPYDHSIRAQILLKNQNPWYYNLIMSFYKATNIPILLNTSLNVHGKPIAMDENDAIEILEKTNLQYMILGNTLIFKSD